jgi:hypothetical protein
MPLVIPPTGVGATIVGHSIAVVADGEIMKKISRRKGAALRQRPTHDGYNCPECSRRWQSYWHQTYCVPSSRILSSPKAPKCEAPFVVDPHQSHFDGRKPSMETINIIDMLCLMDAVNPKG